MDQQCDLGFHPSFPSRTGPFQARSAFVEFAHHCADRRMPRPAAVRIVNVSLHAVFGLGLYLGAVA
jgi:hypothetical protein